MKAAGLSAHQILAPLIVASLGVAALAVRLQRDGGGQVGAHGQCVERRRLSSRSRPTSGMLSNVWVRDGDDLVRARHRRRPRRRRPAARA